MLVSIGALGMHLREWSGIDCDGGVARGADRQRQGVDIETSCIVISLCWDSQQDRIVSMSR